MDAREEFVSRYVRAVIDLPQDVRVACELLDDDEIDQDAQAIVVGSLLSLLQAGDLIPDTWGPLGMVDDAITLRLAAAHAAPAGSAVRERQTQRFPAFFAELEPDLAAARGFLADTFALFDARLPKLRQAEHKGKRVDMVLRDPAARAWLFDEVDEAMTDLEIAEDDLLVAMRRVDSLLTHLRRRLAHR
ncbi:MAG: hypothetical protein HY905_23580 [Deltaproteobacteria bacterium]|nr:hypothetical protein [Deltaproteobacteria bacterium]